MLVVAGGLVAGGCALLLPGGALRSWSIVPSPNPAGSTALSLTGVSCPSTTSCYAVGRYASRTERLSVIEHWNGHAWTIMKSPHLGGQVFLEGVACANTTACVAVGSVSPRHPPWIETTVSEHWDGHAWSIKTNPVPAVGTSAFLIGVSCPNATSCFAVGNYDTDTSETGHSKTLIEHWDGHAWSIMTSPNRTGRSNSTLGGVSCPSPRNCVAVGSDGYDYATLVERWDGHVWSIMTSPNPTGGTNTRLSAVSCPNPTDCVAIGGYATHFAHGLVERWDGHRWSIMPNPDPGTTDSYLNGISCPSTTNCFAIGWFYATSGGTPSLIEHSDGHTWSIMPNPNPAHAYTELDALSCPTTTFCYAVGDTNGKSFTEQYG